jgi:AcrR family transcriptional regulator
MPRTEQQFLEIREKTKAQILKSSLKLFSQNGFSGTSISDIAKDAKISKGLIYNYFESKNDIVKTIYTNLMDEFLGLMLPIREIKDPVEKLSKILSDTIRYTRENKELMKLYMGFMIQPGPITFDEIFSPQFFQNFFAEFESIFKELGSTNPKQEAYEFAAIIDGMQFHYIFMGDLYPLDEMEKHMLEKIKNIYHTK